MFSSHGERVATWTPNHEGITLFVNPEHQFQPKLNLAGTRGCARDFARRRTDAIAGKDDRVRKIEVRPVSDVKKFCPEQHFRLFRDWYGLKHREIEFRQARPIQHSPPQVSPSA